jgi:hypothetical protein
MQTNVFDGPASLAPFTIKFSQVKRTTISHGLLIMPLQRPVWLNSEAAKI